MYTIAPCEIPLLLNNHFLAIIQIYNFALNAIINSHPTPVVSLIGPITPIPIFMKDTFYRNMWKDNHAGRELDNNFHTAYRQIYKFLSESVKSI